MRATRAKIRQPRCNIFCVIRASRFSDPRQTRLDAIGSAPLFNQNITELLGNPNWIKRATRREKLLAVNATCPTFIPAVDTTAFAHIKQSFFDLNLNQFTLFFDDNNQIKPIGPVTKATHIKGEGLPDFISCHAKPLSLRLVNPKQRERMTEIKPVLARRHKPDLRTGFAPNALIHLVGMAKRFRRKTLIINHPRFLLMRCVDQTNVQPTFGHIKFGQNKINTVRITINDGGRLNGILHSLKPDPEACKTAQRPTIHTIINNLLHTRR